MKKISILLAVVLFSGIAITSCKKGNTGKVELKTQQDSLSYAFGLLRSGGISEDILFDQTSGPAYDAFIKGLNKGFASKDSLDEKFVIGFQIGLLFKKEAEKGIREDSTTIMKPEIVKAAMMANISKGEFQFSEPDANTFMQNFFMKKQEQEMADKFGENKTAGEQFLAENKDKEGVITTPSGLQYKIITEGKGEKPTLNNMVKVHYKGTLIDGTEFDSSYARNEPAEFALTQVIPGWTEALQLIPVGSKATIYVPQNLGYGASGTPNIPPFSTLVFDVELLDIVK